MTSSGTIGPPYHALAEEVANYLRAVGMTIMAENLYWVNLTGSPYFQAHRDDVKGYLFYNQLYVYFETTWLAGSSGLGARSISWRVIRCELHSTVTLN